MSESARIHTYGCDKHKDDIYEGCYSCELEHIATLERELAAVKQDREDHADYRDSDCAMLEAERDALRANVKQLERLDSEAATHVEAVIAMRTDFTGEPPYVGWKGLGLSLNEALDERDALRARVDELTKELESKR